MNIFSNSKDFSKIMMFSPCLIFVFASILLSGCEGDESAQAEETSSGQDSAAVANAQAEEKLEDTLEPQILEPEEETEPVEAPNPNGVFLPMYEDQGGKMEVVKLNNHPVYSNGKGYFLWTMDPFGKLLPRQAREEPLLLEAKRLLGPGHKGQVPVFLQTRNMPSRLCFDWRFHFKALRIMKMQSGYFSSSSPFFLKIS